MKPSLAGDGTELKRLLATAGRPLGFVPTMGALHAGHQALIERACSESASVAVSIFVNPLQFGPGEDFDCYPRSLERDRRLCAELGVDVLFVPAVDQMYPADPLTRVSVGLLGEALCGAGRPGHFDGVATVVAKLFNLVQPDAAYFGEKDAQQLAIIRRMVADLSIPVEIRAVETVREPDGLAVSSRNGYLTAIERRAAPSLYRALKATRARIERGSVEAGELEAAAHSELDRIEGLEVDYLQVVDAGSLQPVERVSGPVLIAGALRIGTTRLIDNLRWEPPSEAAAARS